MSKQLATLLVLLVHGAMGKWRRVAARQKRPNLRRQEKWSKERASDSHIDDYGASSAVCLRQKEDQVLRTIFVPTWTPCHRDTYTVSARERVSQRALYGREETQPIERPRAQIRDSQQEKFIRDTGGMPAVQQLNPIGPLN